MTVTREAVLEMLAAFGERAPQQVDEEIGSLELTWLLAEAEQRYGVELDPEHPGLASVHTVGQAVAALDRLVAGG
ncbi:acyl carrier protein [Kitasatospora sp. NPDC058965]|uniref:acyl carrier protein n=1 Tax=Kitasatospora sp. NPDC058965 TaxID=3346682 RepID=UPI0036AB9ABE